MADKSAVASSRPVVRSVLLGLGFAIVVVGLLLWLAGVFHTKIDIAGPVVHAPAGRPPGDAQLVEARLVSIPATEPAVGTIRAVHETAVAAKLLANVVEINVQAGQIVRQGEVLVRLDDEELQARRQQAEAAVSAAEATHNQARTEFERVDRLYQADRETRIGWERARTSLDTAAAELERARQAQREVETVLSYATVRSPIDGRVIDKLVEVGDTVSPGQPLLGLYDPARMQLVARVRESLAQRLEVDQTISVQIDALSLICDGRISEIVPEAEAASRTFSVKVTGPCPEGVYSGMFGRLLIPLDDEDVLLIPRAAVRRVGQLNLVDVAEPADQPQRLQRRAVQLGRSFEDEVEVLAGLRAGEPVAVPAPTSAGD